MGGSNLTTMGRCAWRQKSIRVSRYDIIKYRQPVQNVWIIRNGVASSQQNTLALSGATKAHSEIFCHDAPPDWRS